MAGTVRGTFDLNTTPASSGLRRIREEGGRTDRQMQALGRTIDNIFNARQLAQMQAYRDGLREVNEELLQVALGARETESRLNSLGRTRVTPTVDVRGIDAALARVEFLHERINALGRERATATVGVRGGGVPGGIGRGIATRAAAGGGGFSGGTRFGAGPFSFGRFGPIGATIVPAIGMAAQAAPAVAPLAGSLLGAGVGAGAVGAGALGAVGGSLASILSIAGPTAKAITLAASAQKSLTAAVATYGQHSTEAKTATDRLNGTLAAFPGLAQLFQARTQMSQRFAQVTAPGRRDLIGTLTGGVRTATNLAPLVGGQGNRIFGQLRPAAGNLGDFLQGPNTARFVHAAGGMVAGNLDEAERTFENMLATMENITRASRPFFNEASDWVVTWTKGWRESTNDIGGTRRFIGSMLQDFKSWARLSGATLRLLWDIMMADRRGGRSLIDDLTQQLNTWDRWINRNPRQVKQFFNDSIASLRSIARIVGNLVSFFEKILKLAGPFLQLTSNVATFASGLGPGVIPLALGGLAGGRALGRLRGGALGGTAAAGGGAGLAESAVLGGALGGGARGGGFFRSVTPVSGLAAVNRLRAVGGVAGIGGTFLRGAASRLGPTAALLAGLQFASFPGSFGQRTQAAASGATLGLVPMPKTGDQQADENMQNLQSMIGRFRSPRGVHAATRQANRLRGFIEDIGLTRDPNTFGIAGRPGQMGRFRTFPTKGLSENDAQLVRIVNSQIRQIQSAQAAARAHRGITDIQQAFGIRLRHGESVQDAFDSAMDDIAKKMQMMHGKTQREFSQTTVDWLKQLRQAHPKLKGEINQTMDDIENRLSTGQKRIRIINGKIVDVSANQWDRIRKSMTSSAEKAREEVTDQLTGLQRQAVQSLQDMGFTVSQARGVVKSMEQGKPTPGTARMQQSRARHGQTGVPLHAYGGRYAAGGRLPEHPIYGAQDYYQLPDGSKAGGGELWVNRHTEARANKMLGAFGTSLDSLVRGETKSHHLPVGGAAYGRRRYQRGGRYRMLSGDLDEPKLDPILEQLAEATGHRISIQSGGRTLAEQRALYARYGPGRAAAPTSSAPHVMGIAADITPGSEVFGSAAGRFGLGFPVPGEPWHIQILNPGKVRGGVTQGGTMAGMRMPPLHARRSRFGGLLGDNVNAAGALQAAGMTRAINRRLSRMGGGAFGGGAVSAGGQYGVSQLEHLWIAAGGPPNMARLMAAIALAESGGNPRAHNDSGASGLWQILGSIIPGNIYNPMVNARNAVAKFRTQGLGAWAVYTSGAYRQYMNRGGRTFAGWAGDGADFTAYGPMMLGVGERGAEDVTVRPRRGRAGATHRGAGITNHFHFPGLSVRSDSDIKKIAEAVAKEFKKALDNTDGVPEGAVIA